MELISKISKGSKMDQIYIPKNRSGFSIGSYVVLKPLENEKVIDKPHFYNVSELHPLKMKIVEQILETADKLINKIENVIITGSFLNKGFMFNDIDVLILTEEKLEDKELTRRLEERIRIKMHVIVLSNKELIYGLSTDPIYQMMMSKCIAKRRFIYKSKNDLRYKLLDLHLLKSEMLPENFDYINGSEKYYSVRNMIAISLFLRRKKVSKESVDKETKRVLGVDVEDIKKNMIEKVPFVKKYRKEYKRIFDALMDGVRNGSE